MQNSNCNCMRVNSQWQYQDGSWDSIWDIDEDYSNNKHYTSIWTGLNLQSELKQAILPCSLPCDVWSKELLVHHREKLDLWLLGLALIYAYFSDFIIHVYLMSLVLTRFLCPQQFVCPYGALWSVLRHSDSTFSHFHFHPQKLKIGCWHLLALLVFDIEAVQW